ncbi:hypothetical protein [Methylobacterium sp. ID0610]|uniref:hypothetical protein n=1 Tax=Methylobacterium carpenticola TaxID=3344827 RepID=UPI0036A4659D
MTAYTSAASGNGQFGPQFDWSIVGDVLKTVGPIALSFLQAQPGGLGAQRAGAPGLAGMNAGQPQLGAQFDWSVIGDVIKTVGPIALSFLQAQPGGLGAQRATMPGLTGLSTGQPQLGAQFDWSIIGDVLKTVGPIALSLLQAQPGGLGAQRAGAPGLAGMNAGQPQLGAQFDWSVIGDVIKTVGPIALSFLQAQPGGLGAQRATMPGLTGLSTGQPQLGAQFDWSIIGDVLKTVGPIALSLLQAQPGGLGAQRAGAPGLAGMNAGQPQLGAQFDWSVIGDVIKTVGPIALSFLQAQPSNLGAHQMH